MTAIARDPLAARRHLAGGRGRRAAPTPNRARLTSRTATYVGLAAFGGVGGHTVPSRHTHRGRKNRKLDETGGGDDLRLSRLVLTGGAIAPAVQLDERGTPHYVGSPRRLSRLIRGLHAYLYVVEGFICCRMWVPTCSCRMPSSHPLALDTASTLGHAPWVPG